jgi:heme-degrading monooxygenase HmoA
MLVLLTARRLKPGTFEQWRRAWEPDDWPEQFSRAYVLRNRTDPDEAISFGFWEGSAEDLQAFAGSPEGGARIERMAEFVESKSIDGIYDVEVVEPRRG